MKKDGSLKKRFSLNVNFTPEENERVKNYVAEVAKFGDIKLHHSDVYAALVMTAIENPDFTARVRAYIKGRINETH